MVVGLSIDIEDFYQGWTQFLGGESQSTSKKFLVQCEYLLDVLGERGIKATFFFLGSSVLHCIDIVKRIHLAGHEVAIHGFEHRNLASIDYTQFCFDTSKALDLIQNAISAPVFGYRAPFCSLNSKTSWVLDALKELGFLYDSSLLPVVGRKVQGRAESNVFQFANGIYEIPFSMGTLWGKRILPIGGGYFRRFPYYYSKWVIHQHMQRYGYAVIYHHNYDFFNHNLADGSISRTHIINNFFLWLRLSLCSQSNSQTVQPKFTQLLDEFEFCPLSELIRTTGTVAAQIGPVIGGTTKCHDGSDPN